MDPLILGGLVRLVKPYISRSVSGRNVPVGPTKFHLLVNTSIIGAAVSPSYSFDSCKGVHMTYWCALTMALYASHGPRC